MADGVVLPVQSMLDGMLNSRFGRMADTADVDLKHQSETLAIHSVKIENERIVMLIANVAL